MNALQYRNLNPDMKGLGCDSEEGGGTWCYPPIYAVSATPEHWYNAYLTTYIERTRY